jgi:nicotinamidase-related amidase
MSTPGLPPFAGSPLELRVDPQRTALLIVDVQERLARSMAPGELAMCEQNIVVLLAMAARLHLPVVVSEQYPKGLGRTIAALEAALVDPALKVERFEKMEFGCATVPAFTEIQRRLGRDQWIVVGMEAHICVYQTARGLAALGARVHVPADAVVSRSPVNVKRGLALIEHAGAIVTSTETVVFDALGCAGTDDFRALSRLLK